MKKGDKIKIYQKPITKKDFEGIATLVEQYGYVDNEGDKIENWYVKFDGDNKLFLRKIKTD